MAAALMDISEVVFLDEPFENLDLSSQIRFKKLILQEKETSQVTFSISSHDLNHETEICDCIVLLDKGKIINDMRDKSAMLAELDAYFKR
ncbi:ABC-2 type transport system ATP-binding protein [Algoriphagus yeomjeoni]|uniref:ABC-2 type transport system ATP-binding protein n=1 Tax=Algoriphagus yeomjeoni TaxID=291403 RepID=A0A327PRH3_9BACT|nr:ABC-2 type transport system ATP-binding protein [Algoriphagus yeomjeoni]